jgi:Iron/zinc purple acid phosphatase-like protein C
VRVDLVLTSHVHCYERMWQVRDGAVVAQFSYAGMRTPLYLLQGSAGCIEGSTPWAQMPEWSAVRICESIAFGFSTVEVLNATHLRTSFVAQNGDVLDDAVISKAVA